jgi:hypothetical protein
MNMQQTGTASEMRNSESLFYVVDWLPPDFGAVGQYAMIAATELASNGRYVELIGLTSGTGGISQQQFAGGGLLKIIRIRASSYDKSRNVKRLMWTLRTNLRLIFEVVRNPRSRRAELVFTGSPPFMLLFSFAAKLLRGANLTYRITDVFPEVITADTGKTSIAIRIVQHVIWILRRRVDRFQVLGEDQRELLLKGGIAPNRIVLKRDGSPIYVSGNERPAQRPSSLGPGPMLLYSGNYGVAHEADTVVEGLAEHYRRNGANSFSLWLNASGIKADTVEQRLLSSSVAVARTTPAPLHELPSILAAADVHLITLRPEFVGIAFPSKVYSCICSRRPILFVGPVSSDVHLICSQAVDLRYEQIEPGDIKGFADALDRLAVAPAKDRTIRAPELS